jgi:hypothetical protein
MVPPRRERGHGRLRLKSTNAATGTVLGKADVRQVLQVCEVRFHLLLQRCVVQAAALLQPSLTLVAT